MANIKSAKKRILTINRRTAENKFVKATMSTQIKKLRKMIEEGKIEEADKFSKEVYSYINSACSKGIIHKNTASRKVGRLAAALFKAKATTPVKEAKVEAKTEEVKEEVNVEPTVEAKKTTKKTTKTTEKTTAAKKPAAAKKTTKKA